VNLNDIASAGEILMVALAAIVAAARENLVRSLNINFAFLLSMVDAI
jgi:hypothetical protein